MGDLRHISVYAVDTTRMQCAVAGDASAYLQRSSCVSDKWFAAACFAEVAAAIFP